MHRNTLKALTQTALMVAMEIVLSRFFSINHQIVKIGFGFIPIVVVAMLHGPLWAAAAAAMADFLGAQLFPIGPYFFGFTVTAALVGLVYGVFLHNRAQGLPAIILAVFIVTVPLHLGLNSLWIHILYDKAFWALIPARVLQCVLVAPVQVVVIWFIGSRIKLLKRSA